MKTGKGMTAEMAGKTYLETLLRYFEEEIEGEAFFAALAERLAHADHRRKMRLLARVEQRAAAATRPLIEKYGLVPRQAGELQASGRAEAQQVTSDWPRLVADMRAEFPAHVDDFRRLEAMAPPEDRSALQALTAHEVAAVDFLALELAGDPASTRPLEHYLETGSA